MRIIRYLLRSTTLIDDVPEREEAQGNDPWKPPSQFQRAGAVNAMDAPTRAVTLDLSHPIGHDWN